ncbi:MAG: EAL domain-containing protein [Lachnospiraceae bacterium]|nr:EAL domain-containing protein [Lachnospiraceae bacterium]
MKKRIYRGYQAGNANPKRKNLLLRIMLVTLLSMLMGIGGLLFLSYNQKEVADNYSNSIDCNYSNVKYINTVSRSLYRHQALIYQYMSAAAEGKKREEIREITDSLEAVIEDSLEKLNESVMETAYEPYYHSIYSGYKSYLKNIGYVFYFSDKGDTATAGYYMETALQSYIEKVNQSVEELSTMIAEDMDAAEQLMSRRINFARQSSVLFIILLAAFSLITMIYCSRIFDSLVNKDALTQVDNYEKLQKDSTRLIKHGRWEEYVGVSCNIKDFNYFNQQLGDKTGDMVLIRYAASIAGFLQKGEKIARNGGDNFILLVRQERIPELLAYLQNMEISVDTPEGMKKLTIYSRCGLYQIREQDSLREVVNACCLALADTRMNGAPDHVWYDRAMHDRMVERKEILVQCRKALQEREFVVYYQPKVNIAVDTLCGAEALVRWNRDGQVVGPGQFVPVLEEEGYITELDFYVFEQVCRDIRNWLERGIRPVRISSNFSKLHLRDQAFAAKVLEIVRRYQIDSRYLEIELTESSGYEDFKALVAFVDEMGRHGIYTSIDDFGTGYSSLSLLKNLNVNVVKLDKSFIEDIENADEAHEKMVENVVRMINDLHREVICEGVENRIQADFLRTVNCQQVQGYLYDRPLPHEVFESRLKHPVYGG